MRKRKAKKRPLLPDPKFNDKLVTRFVNMLMLDGKKSISLKIFYDALDIVEGKKQDSEKSSLEIWKEGLSNVMPQVEVRSRSVRRHSQKWKLEVELQTKKRRVAFRSNDSVGNCENIWQIEALGR